MRVSTRQLAIGVVVCALLGASIFSGTADSQEDDGRNDAIAGFYSVGALPIGVAHGGLDLDPATGRLWSTNNNSVTVLDHAGNTVDSFGSSGSGDGEFIGVSGVSIFGFEAFIADRVNNRVQVFDMSGTYLRQFGSATLDLPCGIEAFGGRVYVANAFGDNVTMYLTSGAFLGSFDASESGTTLGIACNPDSVTASGSEVFVADWDNGRVVVFDLDGNWLRDIATGGQPTAVDADITGNIWVTDLFADKISRWTFAGAFIDSIDESGMALGQLDGPLSIVADPTGSAIWTGETDSFRIQIFTSLLCDGMQLTHVGTSYPDKFSTTSGNDVVHVGPGADEIRSLGGDDVVCGGGDADTLRGGGGDDRLDGGDGDDTLLGMGGSDTIFGRAGNDTIEGQGTADSLFGGGDDDTMSGGNGADTAVGGAGNDTIRTQTGPDTLEGDSGDDTLAGGSGNDTLFGGAGVDRCSGNTGPADQAESATCEQTPGVEILF